MFGNKVAALQGQIAGLDALIASTGFKIDAEAATLPTPEAFQAHLKGAQDTATKIALNAKDAALAGAQSEISALRAGFTAAGIKLGEFSAADYQAKEGETLTPAAAAVKSALEGALTPRSTRQIAAAGHPAALDVPAGESPGSSASADGEPATAADFKTALDAIKDPGARTAYFRKHKAKFIK